MNKLIKCNTTRHLLKIKYPTVFINKEHHFRTFCSLYLNYSAFKYTEEDQKYILKIVNEESENELKRFALTQGRIKNLKSWKKKRGDFKTVSQVLDVEGFGVKVLEKFCDSIIESKSGNSHNVSEKIKSPKALLAKKINNFVTPPLSKCNINKVVSVNIGISTVSWSTFNIDDEELELTDWRLHDFTDNTKKLHIANTIQLVYNIARRIPTADVYVLESPPSNMPNQSQGSKTIFASSQKSHLVTMLSGILANRSWKLKNNGPSSESGITVEGDYDQEEKISVLPSLIKDEPKITDANIDTFQPEPNVYYLRSLLASRLFQTVVGNERVSVENEIITKFINTQWHRDIYNDDLENSNEIDELKPSSSLRPPIYIPKLLTNMYMSALPVHKEQLGQAFLLGMAFIQLCIFKDEKSITKVTKKRINE